MKQRLIQFHSLLLVPAFVLSAGSLWAQMPLPSGHPNIDAPHGDKKPMPQSGSIHGFITNVTTGAPTRVDKLSLLRPSQGMAILEAIENAGPSFEFKPITLAGGPLLLRAEYGGDSYVSVINPGPKILDSHKVTVFETGAPSESVRVTQALQVMKTEQGLKITKIVAVDNASSPPRSTKNGELKVYIPEEAPEVKAQVTHESSQMPVKVEIKRDKTTGIFARGIRPGSSEITIEYTLQDNSFKDELASLASGPPQKHAFAVMLWKPEDAKPTVTGGKAENVDIPDFGKAIRVSYPASGTVTYDFSAGSLLIIDPETADRNPLFDSAPKTVAGIAVTLAFLLALMLVLSMLKRQGAHSPS
ncbi:MAG: hypothetical protein HY042_09705 [Spirochaetia bacterium]|nr:hypothetical protein [Spirochaetia bacterium]